MNKRTATERRQLAGAYEALLGVASEQGTEAFNAYHKRGGNALFNELASIFTKLAPAEMKKVLG